MWKARLASIAHRHQARAGQVIARTDGSFTVLCGGGTAIEVTDWECASTAGPTLHAQLGAQV